MGKALYNLPCDIYGINICDDAAYFQEKIREDFRTWKKRYNQTIEVEPIKIPMLDGHVGPGYAMAEPPVFETIKTVAQTTGILLDPVYTGKAFHGLLEELKKGTFANAKNVLFIHTGGLFGSFAQREKYGM